MSSRFTAFDPADMQLAAIEIDGLPAQPRHLGGTEPVAERHQDHGRVAMAMPVGAGGLDQPFDLALGQIFTRPDCGIRAASAVVAIRLRRKRCSA